MTQLQIGIIGAGPVVQSIHLPAIARRGEEFRVARIADVVPDVVAAVAGRVGAEAFTSVDEMLAEGGLDVVAVCSPAHLHAEHVEAVCRTGIGVILCEKPFASSRAEAERIVRSLDDSGARVVVGAMHMYDPAWTAAAAEIGDLRESAHTVRSSIVMPGGPRFEDFATEVLARPAPPSRDDLSSVERAAAFLQGVIYGLLIHDLPLVRRFAPEIERIIDVRVDAPTWTIAYEGAGRLVHLTGGMTGGWKPEWHFQAYSATTSLELEFMPSYVWAGSGSAEVVRAGRRTVLPVAPRNGYEAEWGEVGAIARGEKEPMIPTADLVADVRYAVDLAERTHAFLLEGGVR